MIIFEDIEIEGFGSVHDRLSFKLNKGNSLNVIRGHVGSGKTTIPSAIYYALYGKTLKEKGTVETWPELQDETYRGTYVRLNYRVKDSLHSVIRCKGFKSKITVGLNKKLKGSNGLYYLIDGELVTVSKGKGNIQSLIEKNLGYSMDLFKNSIIFGQKMKRIIEETGPMKKKVFEEAFEVGFIDEAKDLTQKDKVKLLETQKEIIHKLREYETKLENKEELYEQSLEREKNFDLDKEDRIKEYKADIRELREEQIHINYDIKQLNPQDPQSLLFSIQTQELKITKYKKHNKKVEELKQTIAEYKELIKENKEALKSKKPLKCSECGGILTNEGFERKKLKWKIEIDDTEILLKKARKQLKSLGGEKDLTGDVKELARLKDKLAIVKHTEKEWDRLEKRAEDLIKKIKTLEGRIKQQEELKLEIKSELYSKAISRLTRSLKKQQKQKKLIDNEIEIQNWLITDPLSNNGLKAYMFDNLLQSVNDKLDEYSKILGFQVEFGINLDSHRKEFYQAILKNDIVIPYEDLSGGQKQLIDTTVAFAIHDVISSIRPTNLLFLDEPFESLDIDNIEIVAELVQEKAKNKSLFLITHHQAFSPVNANYISISLDENQHTIIT